MERVKRSAGCFLAALLPLAGPGAAADIAVDARARTVRIPVTAVEQGKYEVLKGAIEYVLVAKGGKEYESLFVTECTPEALHAAMREAGLEPGKPGDGSRPPRGTRVRIAVELEEGGKAVQRPADELILHAATGARLKPRSWVFTGSTLARDPETGKDVLQCAVTRSLVGLHLGDPSSLIQSSRSEAAEENLYRADARSLPAPGKPVTLVIGPFTREIPQGTRRVRVFIRGRVQGVGFRAYTEGQAKRQGLEGFVRNLADGRVEAVLEGPAARVAEVLAKLEKGPRAARVEGIEVKEEPPTGEFEEFRVELASEGKP